MIQRRWRSRYLLKHIRFAYYSLEFNFSGDFSLNQIHCMSFVRNFCRKGFFAVFLHSWVALFTSYCYSYYWGMLVLLTFRSNLPLVLPTRPRPDWMCVDGPDRRGQVLLLILKCSYVTTGDFRWAIFKSGMKPYIYCTINHLMYIYF